MVGSMKSCVWDACGEEQLLETLTLSGGGGVAGEAATVCSPSYDGIYPS